MAEPNPDRIAELSAQLCARLSYAAAKVERDWEFDPTEGKYVFSRRNSLSTSPKAARHTPKRTPRPPKVEKSVSPRQRHINGGRIQEILEGRSSTIPGSYSTKGAMQACQKDISASRPSGHLTNSKCLSGSLDMAQIPRLAPPADIVSGTLVNPRRRPNANDAKPMNASNSPFSPSFRPSLTHQSSAASSLGDPTSSASLIPGTPPQPQFPQLSSTPSNSIHPLAKQRTPSQNALMEQDAIETLLFMSSPENSGYFPTSQHQPKPLVPRSANITPLLSTFGSESASNASALEMEHDADRHAAELRDRLITSNSSRAYGRYGHNRMSSGAALEHEAGDEIDRMLDAMVDSDEELDFDWLSSLTNQVTKTGAPPSGPDPSALIDSQTQSQP
ncbi:hypothetical protein PRK78_002750 [Emydomyces testavorans]|uniref:Uncharacterized protein n=1 Tax=Emydomyces testavorans TaxID=2070801 RepID=A0AAF0DEW4_9EURO|nr:hypothetical protein PRK78_002750 [Emydomyces testavorans]